MLRARRCTECKQRFYSREADVKQCQNCTGSHDNTKTAERDEKNVRKANETFRSDEPQAVDPRAGAPKKTRKKGTPST